MGMTSYLEDALLNHIFRGHVPVGSATAPDDFFLSGTTITLTIASAEFNAGMIGKDITIAGATTGGNNGTFTIDTVPSSTSLTYENASGFSEDFNGTYSIDRAFTQPTALYLALFTADPTNDGLLTNEVSTAGGSLYARVAVELEDPFGGNGAIENEAMIAFPTAGANWGTVTHFGIADAASAGNLLFAGPLTIRKNVVTGQTFRFPKDTIRVKLI